jgi:hypothetical protein
MKFRSLGALAALSVGLSGCISVFEGTGQDIQVVTTPAGAQCDFERQGSNVGRIPTTPGTLHVQKRKYDITIKCNKPGFQEATYLNHSGVDAAIAANVAADLIFTAGISSIVDSSTGADNKYDSVVNMTLLPAGTQAAVTVSPTPVAASTK